MQVNDPFNPNLMFNQFSNLSVFTPTNAPLITVDPNAMIKPNTFRVTYSKHYNNIN